MPNRRMPCPRLCVGMKRHMRVVSRSPCPRKAVGMAPCTSDGEATSMVRISLSADETAFVAARIGRFHTKAPKRHRVWAEDVARYAALPLYVGWTEILAIRIDGTIVRWRIEEDYDGCREEGCREVVDRF